MGKREAEETLRVRLSKLSFNEDIYPRKKPDSLYVKEMYEAYLSGTEFPKILVAKGSLEIIDGVHRWLMLKRAAADGKAPTTVLVRVRSYQDKLSRVLAAAAPNAEHGQRLSKSDKVRVYLKARELGADDEVIKSTLNWRPAQICAYLEANAARFRGDVELLKPSLRDTKAGKELTVEEKRVNDSLGGNRVGFLFNQVISLLEIDAVPVSETNRNKLEKIIELGTKWLQKEEERSERVEQKAY